MYLRLVGQLGIGSASALYRTHALSEMQARADRGPPRGERSSREAESSLGGCDGECESAQKSHVGRSAGRTLEYEVAMGRKLVGLPTAIVLESVGACTSHGLVGQPMVGALESARLLNRQKAEQLELLANC